MSLTYPRDREIMELIANWMTSMGIDETNGFRDIILDRKLDKEPYLSLSKYYLHWDNTMQTVDEKLVVNWVENLSRYKPIDLMYMAKKITDLSRNVFFNIGNLNTLDPSYADLEVSLSYFKFDTGMGIMILDQESGMQKVRIEFYIQYLNYEVPDYIDANVSVI